MPHPNFFGFGSRPRKVRPDDPRRPPVLRPDHAPARARFPSVPCPGFEHDSGRFAAALSKRCQPAPERGRGGDRMGRTQAHGVTGPIVRVHPAYVSHTLPGPPAKSGTAIPEKARAGAKALLRSLRRTVPSARFRRVRPVGLAQDFVTSGVPCRSAASL